MFELSKLVFSNFIFLLISVQICTSELPTPVPHLSLYSPDYPPLFTDILVKRVNDNLTLVCELPGDDTPRMFVWNVVEVNGTAMGQHSSRPFTIEPLGPTATSTLLKHDLQVSDSGHYMCSSPPFSITKFILVQQVTSNVTNCVRGSFVCGARCVLPPYVCDGRADCLHGEDERPPACPPQVCQRPEMLNCSTGRCIPVAACCPRGSSCHQPDCCLEYRQFRRPEGFDVEIDYPALYEDRHVSEDYGFIQSTIYTVTACALIFMIAAVLLVSAICKMHMKRVALRSYARAAAAHHYTSAHQAPRFPPCYEASRLLEQAAAEARPPTDNTQQTMQESAECPVPNSDPNSVFDLARLSSIFSARYRQVPTECADVEMTAVQRAGSASSSPRRAPAPLPHYRSPTYADLNDDYFFNPETGNCGRELNLATCGSGWRRRARPLTLQLGRFQLSLPRFGRADSRPDTPNVAEIDIDDLDFVRLGSNDTYTLNGRTIRLLGANFENYPQCDATNRPPPYEVRFKAAGPPPEYLSRDGLNDVDEEAAGNVEMPPRYEDLNSNEELVQRVSVTLNVINESTENVHESIENVIDNLPAIDSDVNANEVADDNNN